MLVNNTLSKVIIFTAGATVGSAVTYLLVKKRCEQKAQEEIDKVVDEFYNREITIEDVVTAAVEEGIDVNFCVEPKETEEPVDEKEEYEDIVKGEKYVSYAQEKLGKKEEKNDMKRPYVIPPEEYGECDYATVSLWYWADGVITNERNKIIKNVEELVGENVASHFGEYEEDSVFIRNEVQEIDYEILRDERRFSEIS